MNKLLFLLMSLFLVAWLNYNQVSNWHFHHSSYGAVVVHAHPYKSNTIPDTPFQKHQHNRFEFLFLSMVFNAIPLVILFFLSILFKSKLKNLLLLSAVGKIQHNFYPVNLLRGPPAF